MMRFIDIDFDFSSIYADIVSRRRYLAIILSHRPMRFGQFLAGFMRQTYRESYFTTETLIVMPTFDLIRRISFSLSKDHDTFYSW